MQRQLTEKDEELASAKTKAEKKLVQVRTRLEESIARLNGIVEQQLSHVSTLKSEKLSLLHKIGELEKEILLRDAVNVSGTAFTTLNTSKAAASVDIGKMSLRDLRRED